MNAAQPPPLLPIMIKAAVLVVNANRLFLNCSTVNHVTD